MLNRPKKDLAEVFGYSPDDISVQCRTLWDLSACPFINSQCTKTNHDGSIVYGTCSVTTPYGDCVICPNRLYEDDYAVLKTISHECFGSDIPFLMYNQFIPQRAKTNSCVVALGQNSGREVKIGRSLSMDWVLAKIENHKLVSYIGVEVQSIDITGNYRDSWYAYKNIQKVSSIPASEHGLNWANVHKRLIPQIIRKGIVYSKSNLVHRGLFFVVPEVVYLKFEEIIGSDIPLVNSDLVTKDVLTIHTYGLTSPSAHGIQRKLERKRKLHFSLDEFSSRFISGPNLPKGTELDLAVKKVLGLS